MMTAMNDEFAHLEILLRTLSLGVNVDDTVSSSLTESLSPRSRGTEEEELPDTCKISASEKCFLYILLVSQRTYKSKLTVLAMESFFLWFATGVMRLRNLGGKEMER